MTQITYDQRCDCSRPLGSGRFISRREVCRLCGYFIVTSSTERDELQAAELEADARRVSE